jgi:UTP--glucose-1-phosphate uridylyltransferase
VTTAEDKLRRAGAPEASRAAFRHHYEQLRAGASGTLPDAELTPVGALPKLAELPRPDRYPALARTVVLKLNGGLGTSMGLKRAKSLLEARERHSFLDVIALQVRALRARHRVSLPLVFMNSFYTSADTRAALDGVADVREFLQHKIPRLRASDLEPVECPDDPAAEWCPPGHGDVYAALHSSGMLDALRDDGFRYAFVSNTDNLGAVLDPVILEWFAASGAQFAMEVVVGTEADRKGGHIALRNGHLVLRETAQARPEEVESFRDYRRWRYYNTNNLWLDLDALASHEGVLQLPLIVNRKMLGSTEVIQMESAMGAALSVFEDARALCVPRSRFIPVKTTDDLLALRSDVYSLRPDGRVVPETDPPYIALDPDHYKRVQDFEARFAAGAPSLTGCSRFVVRGDVSFGAGVVARGRVEIHGPADIPDGAVLTGAEHRVGA